MKYELKKFERPNFQVEEALALNKTNVNQRLFEEIRKKEEELFTTVLRTMAEPPIKGEITKGKLNWRGIRLIRQQIGFHSYSWLEQRGKQISPKLHIEVKPPELNVVRQREQLLCYKKCGKTEPYDGICLNCGSSINYDAN